MPSAGNEPLKQRRRPLACQRCRRRKVRCDVLLPSCSNCLKANVPCEDVQGAERSHTLQLSNRIQYLENLIQNIAPEISLDLDPGDEQQITAQDRAIGNGKLTKDHQDAEYAGVFFDLGARPQASQAAPINPLSTTSSITVSNILPSQRLTPSGSEPSPITPATSHISAEQPLAQSVGMISLGHSSDPKYLGPSSGVSFARLIFAAAPPSQGLPIFSASSHVHRDGNRKMPASAAASGVVATRLPPVSEVSHFVSAYIDTFHYLYPFLSEEAIEMLVEGDHSKLGSADQVILYLVISLGARTLESQMNSTSFSSTSYLDTAMDLMARVEMHESIKGVQIMLLLALATFIFPTAPNAWFLVSTIIASCVDLGLQRKQAGEVNETLQNTRRGVFWSAYSLDRLLCTTLGRPLTLRDEAIDIEYPGEGDSTEINLSAIDAAFQRSSDRNQDFAVPTTMPSDKRRRVQSATNSTYAPAIFSFRFDRITAEIKLMIYRVAQIPERFPWPTDLSSWQQDAYKALQSLIEEARHVLRPSRLFGRGSHSDQVLPTLELKFHHCVTILFRPSPAFPRPTVEALRICFESASETIRIHSDLLRFGRLNNSWLAAHTIFVSGITMLYYAWVNPQVLQSSSLDFYTRLKSCSEVLGALGRTWSVAQDAQEKLDQLLQMTKKERVDRNREPTAAAPELNSAIDPLLNGGVEINPSLGGELSFDASWDAPAVLWDELGNMQSWFDLEWIGDNLDHSGDFEFPQTLS